MYTFPKICYHTIRTLQTFNYLYYYKLLITITYTINDNIASK